MNVRKMMINVNDGDSNVIDDDEGRAISEKRMRTYLLVKAGNGIP